MKSVFVETSGNFFDLDINNPNGKAEEENLGSKEILEKLEDNLEKSKELIEKIKKVV